MGGRQQERGREREGERAGGREPAAWVRRIQYDGVGWGEGRPYIENRDGRKCLHSTLRRGASGRETAPSHQLCIYYGFYHLSRTLAVQQQHVHASTHRLHAGVCPYFTSKHEFMCASGKKAAY